MVMEQTMTLICSSDSFFACNYLFILSYGIFFIQPVHNPARVLNPVGPVQARSRLCGIPVPVIAGRVFCGCGCGT